MFHHNYLELHSEPGEPEEQPGADPFEDNDAKQGDIELSPLNPGHHSRANADVPLEVKPLQGPVLSDEAELKQFISLFSQKTIEAKKKANTATWVLRFSLLSMLGFLLYLATQSTRKIINDNENAIRQEDDKISQKRTYVQQECGTLTAKFNTDTFHERTEHLNMTSGKNYYMWWDSSCSAWYTDFYKSMQEQKQWNCCSRYWELGRYYPCIETMHALPLVGPNPAPKCYETITAYCVLDMNFETHYPNNKAKILFAEIQCGAISLVMLAELLNMVHSKIKKKPYKLLFFSTRNFYPTEIDRTKIAALGQKHHILTTMHDLDKTLEDFEVACEQKYGLNARR